MMTIVENWKENIVCSVLTYDNKLEAQDQISISASSLARF